MSRRSLMTRIEGAGEVLLEVEDGRFASARVAMLDSRRGFEQLVRGRHCSEIPALVSRVCAICSASHRVVAARALEQALQVQIPPAAARLRELLLLGALIESHALHLFLLVEPDRHGCDSLADLLIIEPELVNAGLELRQLGNRIQEIAGGRAVHPPNVELGGMVSWPAERDLCTLREQVCRWQQRWPDIATVFTHRTSYPDSTKLAVQELVATGENLRVGTKTLALKSYAEAWTESIPGYTRASHYRSTGAPLLCGALARTQQSGRFVDNGLGAFANCAAQAQEIAAALDLVSDWFAQGRDAGPLRVGVPDRAGVGVAALEAPRGMLLHDYQLADDGCVVAATIITPTAINQLAMEAQLCADLHDAPDDAELPRRAARIVRAFDPCISCAVHVLRSG